MGLKSSKPKANIVMMGLDAAGKTTMLYRLHYGEVATTIPTIGFNVETVVGPEVAFTVWDVGGKDKIRPLWRHYYAGMDAIIFMVDSNDRERVDHAREQLGRVLSEKELHRKCLLLYFNKQDLPGALRKAELIEKMRLDQICTRHWHAQECCAQNGDGLQQGLDWLLQAIRLPPRDTFPSRMCPGRYITCVDLPVSTEGFTTYSANCVGVLEEGTEIEVVDVVDDREYLETPFGRIQEPYAGWIDLSPDKVQSRDYVVSLEVLPDENDRFQLNCTNLAGSNLVVYELTKDQTVAEFQSKLADTLKIPENTLKVVLPDLKLLSALPPSSCLLTAIRKS